jgi:hypothetical protein
MDVLADENGDDLHWWATDLASKNRFTSPLPELLNAFAHSVEAIRAVGDQGQLLVLVQPPWPVVGALKDSARQYGWDFKVISWPGSRLLARWQGKAGAWIGFGKDCLSSIRRILEARHYFGRTFWKGIGRKPVYLIKSFAYHSSFSENLGYQDPFFGELSKYLSDTLGDKIDILTVAVCPEKRGQCLKRMRQDKKANRVVPLEAFLSWRDVLKSFLELIRGRLVRPFRITREVLFLDHKIGALIRECLASGGWKIPVYQYLHLAAGTRISKMCKLFSCVMTFEGNPWERMLIAGLKRDNSQMPVYGYQHSVVPQTAAGVFISSLEKEKSPLPHTVLTTGEIPAKIIRQHGALPEDHIRAACALRYQYLYNSAHREMGSDKRGFHVLVALEGVWPVLSLLEYVLDQAPGCPDTLFRIRAHPVLPLSKLLKRLGRNLQPSGNVTVSPGGTVASDVKDCSAVLYWGTTVALEAMMMGKPLIHFDRGDLLSYDPLFELNHFKWTTTRDQDLSAILEQIMNLSSKKRLTLQKEGIEYIRSYFNPVSQSAMNNFIPAYVNARV